MLARWIFAVFAALVLAACGGSQPPADDKFDGPVAIQSISMTGAVISWPAAPASIAANGYEYSYVNDCAVQTVPCAIVHGTIAPAEEASLVLVKLIPGTRYTLMVAAVDREGRLSEPLSTVFVTLPNLIAQAPVVPPVTAAPETPIPASREVLFSERWSSLSVGGTIRHNWLVCGVDRADPNKLIPAPPRDATARWIQFGNSSGPLGTSDGALVVDSKQGRSGFALLSSATFNASRKLTLQTTAELEQDPGAWFGLTLIQDESDYRELSLRWESDTLYVDIYAPCFIKRLSAVSGGQKALALEYDAVSGWSYWVDGVLLYEEPIDNLGAILVGDPRIGLYFVNVESEAGIRAGGRVRATIGPITVTSPAI